jgi:hypothetical protein
MQHTREPHRPRTGAGHLDRFGGVQTAPEAGLRCGHRSPLRRVPHNAEDLLGRFPVVVQELWVRRLPQRPPRVWRRRATYPQLLPYRGIRPEGKRPAADAKHALCAAGETLGRSAHVRGKRRDLGLKPVRLS